MTSSHEAESPRLEQCRVRRCPSALSPGSPAASPSRRSARPSVRPPSTAPLHPATKPSPERASLAEGNRPEEATEERPLLKAVSRVGRADLSVVTAGQPQHYLATADPGASQARWATVVARFSAL